MATEYLVKPLLDGTWSITSKMVWEQSDMTIAVAAGTLLGMCIVGYVILFYWMDKDKKNKKAVEDKKHQELIDAIRSIKKT